MNAQSAHMLARAPLGAAAEARYGAPYWVIHRGDLQAALIEAVGAIQDISLHLGARVEDFALHRNGVTISALASPAEPVDLRGENAASLSDQPTYPSPTMDIRGEHAASPSNQSVASGGSGLDLRSENAREPFVPQPVVVEVDEPIADGFDWTEAIIGMGAGLALAVLAGVGVAGGRRRHGRPTTV